MIQPPDPVTPVSYQSPGQPPAGRHGCLTAWLVLIIVVCGVAALATPFTGEMIHRAMPRYPQGMIWVSAALYIVNIACAIGLLQYKKWGFWGIVAVNVISAVTNIAAGLGAGGIIGGAIGVAILYGVLNIGDANQKAWPRLK